MPVDKLYVEIDTKINDAVAKIDKFYDKVSGSVAKLDENSKSLIKTTSNLDKSIEKNKKSLIHWSDATVIALASSELFSKQIKNALLLLFSKLKTGIGKASFELAKFGTILARNVMPAWAKWALGIGAVIAVWKTLDWAIGKAFKSLTTFNNELEGKTKSVLLMHKGQVIELNKQYNKLRYDLSDAEAKMLQDYDNAITYFKQSNVTFSIWWETHSPWKRLKRGLVVDAAGISKTIMGMVLPYYEFQKALRSFEVEDWYEEVNAMAMFPPKEVAQSIEDFIGSLKTGKQTVFDLFNTSKQMLAVWTEQAKSQKKAFDNLTKSIVDVDKPIREFIMMLTEGIEGPINNINDLYEKLENLGLTKQDLALVAMELHNVDMSEEQRVSLDALILKIQEIVRLLNLASGIKIIDLPETQPVTPVGRPEQYFEYRDVDESIARAEKAYNKFWMEMNKHSTDSERAMEEAVKRMKEFSKEGKENNLQASAALFSAAGAFSSAAGDMSDSSDLAMAAAIAQQLAAIAMAWAAFAQAMASSTIALATLRLMEFAAILTTAAGILGIITTISKGKFDKGGFVSKGAGTFPQIPQAADGYYTGKLPREGMLINVHSDELIANKDQWGSVLASFAQNVINGRMSPMPAVSSVNNNNNGVTIAINANDSLHDQSFWDGVIDKIDRSLQTYNYARV